MKRIALISLIGPTLLIIWRLVDVVKKVSILGFGNNYHCDFSTHAKCSLQDYIFKSDYALISYIGMVLSFIFLFIITSYIFFLIKSCKENRFKMFWSLISVTIFILFLCAYLIFQFGVQTFPPNPTERKEAVFCPTTGDSNGPFNKCYVYRCNTGFIYNNIARRAPGNNPLDCSDGSKIEEVREE